MSASLLFVTDPLCSWCWGTLPEIEATRTALEGDVDFDLIMAGLQVGGVDGLAEYNKQQLKALWREVRAVTGQQFSGAIPPNFVYHSEVACRAVEIARQRSGSPPWDFFHKLQSAFYVDGLDVNRSEVLAPLLELPHAEVKTMLADSAYVEAARLNFERAKFLSANALPAVYLNGRLVCGGYVTARQLIPDLRQWLQILAE